jgi:radical SAM superfamily enzyme YgiQ (UPF0313 family)
MKKVAVFFEKQGTTQPLEYRLIPGFRKPWYAYELPLWAAYLGSDVELFIIKPRDRDAPRIPLGVIDADLIFVSVMDTNIDDVTGFVNAMPDKHFVLGGYVNRQAFDGYPNVKWLDHPPLTVPNYDIFLGTECIPRLELSHGCRYNCAFCSVVRGVYDRPDADIFAELESINKNLIFDYIYIGDKTFGQASNYFLLPELARRIGNNNFEGFIIQTTAPDLLRLVQDNFLERSKVKLIEVGVESFNDFILKHYKKPSTEALIRRALDELPNGILIIPNIVIGFPQETDQTYQRTYDFITENAAKISHLNIYNMAVYDNARDTSKLPQAIVSNDRNENETIKSWGDQTIWYQRFNNLNRNLIYSRYAPQQ